MVIAVAHGRPNAAVAGVQDGAAPVLDFVPNIVLLVLSPRPYANGLLAMS